METFPAHRRCPLKPTIKDVAERAGCAIATVSRVLNGSGPASVDTRERVLRAVAELGFSFNEMGRSLKRQRSRTVGVVVPSLTNPVFAEAVEGVQRVAATNGFDLLLTCANYDRRMELDTVSTLLAKQVEAIVLTVSNPLDSPALGLIAEADVPACLIFNQPRGRLWPAVGVDNVGAARAVGERLLGLGHSHATFVALRFARSERSIDRYEGLRQAYRQRGGNEPALLEVDPDFTGLEVRFAELYERDPAPSAVFASNDMLALACMRALRAIGKRVPEDVSVVGFDGIKVAGLATPELATIVTPCRDMGEQAMQLLVNALRGGTPPPRRAIALPFEFRSGQSLARAPLAAASGVRTPGASPRNTHRHSAKPARNP